MSEQIDEIREEEINEEQKLKTRQELIDAIREEVVTKDEIDDDENDELNLDSKDKKLFVDKSDPDIETLFNRYKKGTLILQPKFQRKYVMQKSLANKLIESLLLDVPLPMFYFAEEEGGKVSVIDGQQRLTSIFAFIDDRWTNEKNGNISSFKLSGLKVLSDLNGKSFKDLNEENQNKILYTSVRVVTIKKESNPDLKFEIFERLNTGSTPLNEDEIRNTVYRGSFIDMLAELEEDKIFNELVNKPNFKNRMLYRGMILRFFAFYEKTYLKYKPSMKQFCNKFLEEKRNINEKDVAKFKKVFKDTIELVKECFGKNAFRRIVKDESSNDCNIVSNTINMSLFDIQMCGFTKYSKSQIYPHLEEINEAMMNLMLSDPKFIDSIQLKTSNSDMVEYRFKTWLETLDKIVREKQTDRLFSYSVKKELYEKDPTCKICNQHINNIESAHVDHIVPYSKGGKTVIENAQLTHRWCNLHKSDKIN